jgi:hypothetical protein
LAVMVLLPMSCTSVALPQPPTPLRDMRSPGLVAIAGALLLGTADYSGMVVARKSHPTRAEEAAAFCLHSLEWNFVLLDTLLPLRQLGI